MKAGGEADVRVCWEQVKQNIVADLNGDGVEETVEHLIEECGRKINSATVSFAGTDQYVIGEPFDKNNPKSRKIFVFHFQKPGMIFKDRGGRSFAIVDGLIEAVRVYLDMDKPTSLQREAKVGNDWVLLENLQYSVGRTDLKT